MISLDSLRRATVTGPQMTRLESSAEKVNLPDVGKSFLYRPIICATQMGRRARNTKLPILVMVMVFY